MRRISLKGQGNCGRPPGCMGVERRHGSIFCARFRDKCDCGKSKPYAIFTAQCVTVRGGKWYWARVKWLWGQAYAWWWRCAVTAEAKLSEWTTSTFRDSWRMLRAAAGRSKMSPRTWQRWWQDAKFEIPSARCDWEGIFGQENPQGCRGVGMLGKTVIGIFLWQASSRSVLASEKAGGSLEHEVTFCRSHKSGSRLLGIWEWSWNVARWQSV